MNINIGWRQEDATATAMYTHGKNYLYSLIVDYERYMVDFGFIPVAKFITGWTCIPPHIFKALKPTDRVYNYKGEPMIVVDEPYTYNEDEESWYIEVCSVDEDGNESKTSFMMDIGELYSYNVIHMDYNYKNIKPKGEQLCPILITETKQPQN